MGTVVCSSVRARSVSFEGGPIPRVKESSGYERQPRYSTPMCELTFLVVLVSKPKLNLQTKPGGRIHGPVEKHHFCIT